MTITQGRRSLSSSVRLARLRLQGDGTVMDLSEFDFPTTGQLIDFELEIDDGFDLDIEVN